MTVNERFEQLARSVIEVGAQVGKAHREAKEELAHYEQTITHLAGCLSGSWSRLRRRSRRGIGDWRMAC